MLRQSSRQEALPPGCVSRAGISAATRPPFLRRPRRQCPSWSVRREAVSLAIAPDRVLERLGGGVKRRAAVIPTRGVDEAAEEERALLPPVGKVLADLFKRAFQCSG